MKQKIKNNNNIKDLRSQYNNKRQQEKKRKIIIINKKTENIKEKHNIRNKKTHETVRFFEFN